MREIDVNIELGGVQTVTVLDTATGQPCASGPCRLAGWSLRATGTQTSQESEGTVVSPAAGATVTSITLPQGVYTVAWNVMLTGTVGAADTNNFQLLQAASALLTSVNGITVGQEYNQAPVTVTIPQGGATIFVKTIGAGTVASSYTAQLSISPAGTVAIAEIMSGGYPVAEITLPLAGSETVFISNTGAQVAAELTLVVLSGTVRGAVYVIQDYLQGRWAGCHVLQHGDGSG